MQDIVTTQALSRLAGRNYVSGWVGRPRILCARYEVRDGVPRAVVWARIQPVVRASPDSFAEVRNMFPVVRELSGFDGKSYGGVMTHVSHHNSAEVMSARDHDSRVSCLMEGLRVQPEQDDRVRRDNSHISGAAMIYACDGVISISRSSYDSIEWDMQSIHSHVDYSKVPFI